MPRRLPFSFLALFTLVLGANGQDVRQLREEFRNPPQAAKPQTWWHWINGNVSKQGIKDDLESIKRVGLGGAQIFNVDPGVPHGSVQFNSDQWLELTRYAAEQAKRLGLQLCIHNGAGWSSSGGPWVKPEDAMQRLAWTRKDVTGPTHVDTVLPRASSPVANYYRDVAVLAFPTPTDEAATKDLNKDLPGITAVNRQDGIQETATPLPAGATIHQGRVINLTSAMDARGRLDWAAPAGQWTILRIGHVPTGAENEPAPPEGRGLEEDKLSATALDHFWSGMMGRVLTACGTLSPSSLDDVLIDSYEVGSQNWAPEFRAEFIRMRGYDPVPYLPDVAGFVIGSDERRSRFLWDWRRTIADLWARNYYGHFAQICHEHGLKLSIEPYGNGTFDTIQCAGTADIPMGEFWVGGMLMESCKMVASATHVYGIPVAGAESFTAGEEESKYKLDPYAIKALGDLAFCSGINRFIFHEYAMQPAADPHPGMSLGPFGTHFGRGNTWWEKSGPWVRYLTRCQALLQAGHFSADLCYYVGENAPNDLPGRSNLVPKPPAGYDYDGIDTKALLTRFTVKNHRLILPSGEAYAVLVLPKEPLMTPGTLSRIRQLVANGATVVGPKPVRSPSLVGYPGCDAAVRRVAEEIWGNCDGKLITEHRYGAGRVVWGEPLEHLLPRLGVSPDVEVTHGRAKLATIHRVTADSNIYFVSNQRYRTEDLVCRFRDDRGAPQLWHPDTGAVEPAPVWSRTSKGTDVTLHLDPAGSEFVIFAPGPEVHHARAIADRAPVSAGHSVKILSARYEAASGGAAGADVTAKVIELVNEGETAIPATNEEFGDPAVNIVKKLRVTYTLDGKTITKTVGENGLLELYREGDAVKGPDYDLRVRGELEILPWTKTALKGRDGTLRVMGLPSSRTSIVSIAGPWRVTFPPKLGAPARANFDKLVSWTDRPETGIKYFSGTAEYDKGFWVDRSWLWKGGVQVLDLGEVKNLAHVWLNGRDLGTLWKPPFRVNVSGVVKAGRNELRVQVTNLWPNRMIGDERYPSDLTYRSDGQLSGWPDWYVKGMPRPSKERVTLSDWQFYGADSPLLPSGLIGAVRLEQSRWARIATLPPSSALSRAPSHGPRRQVARTSSRRQRPG